MARSRSIENFLQILDKVHNGPVCTEKEWLTKIIPTRVLETLKKYRLQGTLDRENPINTDDSLVDEFFKAAFDFAVEVGILATDTERIVHVNEQELINALRDAPSELTVGKGQDVFLIKTRKPEDPYPPELNAPLGLIVSEDIWIPLMVGIAQLREVDTFQGGSIVSIFGRPSLGGTPYETLLGRYQAQLTKEVLWRAGRPGMHTEAVISSTTQYAQLGGFGINGGFDSANSEALVLIPGELETTYMSLHKVAHAINCNAPIHGACTSMIGGYSGSPEGAALTYIANSLLQYAIHQATTNGGNIVDTRYSGNCGREGQWAVGIAYQAISRNTHLLHRGPGANQVAGPCTDMLLYESAVGMLNASASGAAGSIVPRSGGGRYTDFITPLEVKFCGEVLKSSAGMSRKQANEIVKILLPKYEEKLSQPLVGKGCRECYNLEKLEPSKEWLDIYLKVKKELIDLGVNLNFP
jgi:methylamine--corrinoid protein Co-methyltransferase